MVQNAMCSLQHRYETISQIIQSHNSFEVKMDLIEEMEQVNKQIDLLFFDKNSEDILI